MEMIYAFAAGVILTYLALEQLPKLMAKSDDKEAVEEALQPYLYYGISAAYKLSERGMDELRKRMAGPQKAEVASMVYDLLPEEVAGIKIKKVINQNMLHGMIQNAFAGFEKFFYNNQAEFMDVYDRWKMTHEPDSKRRPAKKKNE